MKQSNDFPFSNFTLSPWLYPEDSQTCLSLTNDYSMILYHWERKVLNSAIQYDIC